MLKYANKLTRDKKYKEALEVYKSLLSCDHHNIIQSVIGANIDYVEFKIQKKYDFVNDGLSSNNKFANVDFNQIIDEVDNSDLAHSQVSNMLGCRKLRPGITALIRAKDAERFIEGSITSIIDIVDDVVAVDNFSQDSTLDILLKLSSIYKNLRVYSYKIQIPKVGESHANAVESGSTNTLGTFYNWCLSKVSTTNVLKWDADFIAIRENLSQMIDIYDLRNSTSNASIWCTGITSFYGRVLRPDSWYDEYRVFSAAYGAKWENYKGCETIVNSINASDSCVVYGFAEDSRSVSSEILAFQKRQSKPVFIEIKDAINIKPDSMVIDGRDYNDNVLINKYINKSPNYKLPNLINEYRVLITIPSLSIGGGNYWAKLVFNQLSYLGVHVDVGVRYMPVETGVDGSNEPFYDFPSERILLLAEHTKHLIGSYTHVILSCPFDYESYISTLCKVFVFTHSDVSYINNYALASGYTPVALNAVTVRKFSSRNINCKLLYNYQEPATIVNANDFNTESINILYCNRISFDKNVLMVLLAMKYLVDELQYKSRVKFTLLAGGSETSPNEFASIKSAIAVLNLGDTVVLLESQRDVEKFYLSHDFCILASVSEGCSYGLLEAINYQIPIVATHILPNLEVLGNSMPTFDLNGIRDRSNSVFCVNNYYDYLEDIGYISKDMLECSEESAYIFNYIYNDFLMAKSAMSEKVMSTIYVPYLIPALDYSVIVSAYVQYLKDFGMYDALEVLSESEKLKVLDNKFFEISDNLKDFVSYCKLQSEIFNNGALKIRDSMLEMIENHSRYKSNISTLKSDLNSKYFSLASNRIQLYDLLFSDDLLFDTN